MPSVLHGVRSGSARGRGASPAVSRQERAQGRGSCSACRGQGPSEDLGRSAGKGKSIFGGDHSEAVWGVPWCDEAYQPITWDIPLSLQRESACVSPCLADGAVRRADSAQEALQRPQQSSPSTQAPAELAECCSELRETTHQVWQVLLNQPSSLPYFWILGRLGLPANSCAHFLWRRRSRSMRWVVRRGLNPSVRLDWVWIGLMAAQPPRHCPQTTAFETAQKAAHLKTWTSASRDRKDRRPDYADSPS